MPTLDGWARRWRTFRECLLISKHCKPTLLSWTSKAQDGLRAKSSMAWCRRDVLAAAVGEYKIRLVTHSGVSAGEIELAVNALQSELAVQELAV